MSCHYNIYIYIYIYRAQYPYGTNNTGTNGIQKRTMYQIKYALTQIHLSLLFAKVFSHSCIPVITMQRYTNPDNVQGSWGQHGAHLGPTGPRWPHVDPMNFAIWVKFLCTVLTNVTNTQHFPRVKRNVIPSAKFSHTLFTVIHLYRDTICLIPILEATVSCQYIHHPGLAKLTPNFM